MEGELWQRSKVFELHEDKGTGGGLRSSKGNPARQLFLLLQISDASEPASMLQ